MLPLIAALFLLTACGSYGKRLPDPSPQANAAAPCPDLALPPVTADVGVLLDYSIYEAGMYRECQKKHADLAASVSPVEKKFWSFLRL